MPYLFLIFTSTGTDTATKYANAFCVRMCVPMACMRVLYGGVVLRVCEGGVVGGWKKGRGGKRTPVTEYVRCTEAGGGFLSIQLCNVRVLSEFTANGRFFLFRPNSEGRLVVN